jgi:predicted outer membrane repeat protein
MKKSVKCLVVSLLTSLLCVAPSLAADDAADQTALDISARLALLGTFDDNGNAFGLDNARIKGNASRGIFSSTIQLQYSDSDLFLKDGYVGAAFSDLANVTAGRFKMPTDRDTTQSFYDSTTWNKNDVSSRWLSPQTSNRGDGVAISGGVAAGEGVSVTYYAGVFDGNSATGGAIYAGRGTLSLAKAPGLSIGVTVQSQDDAVAANRDFFGVGVDAQYTTTLENAGDIVLAGGWNDYDIDGPAHAPGLGLNAGDGFYVEGSVVLNHTHTVASIPVQFQPFFKYQQFDFDGGASLVCGGGIPPCVVLGPYADQERWDGGINLLLDGVFEDTKLTVNWFNEDSNDGVLIGVKATF